MRAPGCRQGAQRERARDSVGTSDLRNASECIVGLYFLLRLCGRIPPDEAFLRSPFWLHRTRLHTARVRFARGRRPTVPPPRRAPGSTGPIRCEGVAVATVAVATPTHCSLGKSCWSTSRACLRTDTTTVRRERGATQTNGSGADAARLERVRLERSLYMWSDTPFDTNHACMASRIYTSPL